MDMFIVARASSYEFTEFLLGYARKHFNQRLSEKKIATGGSPRKKEEWGLSERKKN